MNKRNWISMFWNSYFAVVFLHFFFSPPKLWLVSFGPPFPSVLVWKANFSNKNIWLWKKKPGITWMDLIGFFKVPLTPYKSIHCLHSVHSHLGKVWHAIIYQLYTKLNVQYLALKKSHMAMLPKAREILGKLQELPPFSWQNCISSSLKSWIILTVITNIRYFPANISIVQTSAHCDTQEFQRIKVEYSVRL